MNLEAPMINPEQLEELRHHYLKLVLGGDWDSPHALVAWDCAASVFQNKAFIAVMKAKENAAEIERLRALLNSRPGEPCPVGCGHAREREVLRKEVEFQSARAENLRTLLAEAIRYLKQGKAQFTPNTTNSLVDEFLKRVEL